MDAPRNTAFGLAAAFALLGFVVGDYGQLAWAAAAVSACAGVVFVDPRWGIVASSTLGLAASGYLFRRKLEAGGTSICNVNQTINCDLVNTSAASMIAGMPVALLGAAFFLGMIVAAAVLTPTKSTRLFQAAGLFGVGGIGFSAYLAYESWQLGAVCVMCVTIYASTALLLLAGLRGVRGETGEGLLDGLAALPGSSAWMTIAGTFVAALLVGNGWWSGHKPVDAATLLAAPVPKPGTPTPPTPQGDDLSSVYVGRDAVPLEGDEPVLGNPNGSIQIVEYADYMCPHCAQAFPLMHQIVESNPEIGLRFRVFPLTGECNPATGPGNHPERCAGALGAQCAQDQGKFWEMAGLLFANQRQMGPELVAAAAQELGLDLDKFGQCMGDPGTLAQVQRDGLSGAALQLHGTPSFFVKGLTPDGRWAETCTGPMGVVQLLKAREAGIVIPPPSQNACPME